MRSNFGRSNPGRSNNLWRAGLAGAAIVITAVPIVAQAVTGPLTCAAAGPTRPWQSVPIPAFAAPQGVDATDAVTSTAVGPLDATVQLATNGTSVKGSNSNGCGWSDIFALDSTGSSSGGISGVVASITGLSVLPGGGGVLAVREGSGSASRPHVFLAKQAARSGYTLSDSGLPAQGAPGVLVAASDGRTVYLSIIPTGSSSSGAPVAGLPIPGQPAASPATGLLYASTDQGQTWALRTPPTALSAATITALVVDPANPERIYGLAGGQFFTSADGGRSVTLHSETGLTALVSLAANTVITFGQGSVRISLDGGSTFIARPTPLAVTSAAARANSNVLSLASGGRLYLLDLTSNFTRATDSPGPVLAGSVLGDRGPASTFYAVAGHELLRYVDPPVAIAPVAPPGGDFTPAPPRTGSLSPANLDLTLAVGQRRTVDYTLNLPSNPTPLDVMYLVDSSLSMQGYITGLKTSIREISQRLINQHIDLHAGVAVLSVSEHKGEPPWADVDPTATDPRTGQNTYEKPPGYKVLRRVGPIDNAFVQGVQAIRTYDLPASSRNDPRYPSTDETTLLSLQQIVTQSGLIAENSPTQVPLYRFPPQPTGFRPQGFGRRVVVLATDEAFTSDGDTGSYPYGTPIRNGKIDLAGVGAQLKAAGVLQIGVTTGGASGPDMDVIAQATGALAGPDGASCGGPALIAAGQPLVCKNESADFGSLLTSVLSSLVDKQDLTLRQSGAISAVSVANLAAVDVKKDHQLGFSVTYSCLGKLAGRYPASLQTLLRGSVVGTARATVTCSADPGLAALLVPGRGSDEQPAAAPPPGTSIVPPPAPPPPAAQPQPQPQLQSQAQANPMTATSLEQQEQLQLALAFSSAQAAREQDNGDTTLAMVDRRRHGEIGAMAVLAVAMTVAAAAGVVGLRSRQQPGVANTRSAVRY